MFNSHNDNKTGNVSTNLILRRVPVTTVHMHRSIKHFECVSVLLRWIFRKWDVRGMDWIELAQDRDRWWALVTAVMKLRVL